jgi:hypothetical protein
MAIKTINIFNGKTLIGTAGTGEIITSNVIDMREGLNGSASVYYNLKGNLTGTCGQGVWSYLGCPVETGTFVQLGTFGTTGTGSTSDVMHWDAVVLPFMKVQVSFGTHGAKLDAQLIVR